MIVREDRGEVALLRLDHGKVSAFDVTLLQGMVDALAEVEGSDARALVLTGTGSVLSAGVDLFRVLEGGDDSMAAARHAVAHAEEVAAADPERAAALGHRGAIVSPFAVPLHEPAWDRLWAAAAQVGRCMRDSCPDSRGA